MNSTVKQTELWNNQTIENICNTLTMADIISVIGVAISIIGLIITVRTFYKAKNAAESAKEAATIAENRANKYSDHLLLHNCQRLTGLMQKVLNVENKQDSIDLCEFIRSEIVDIRKGVTTISTEQKRILQDLTTSLARYNGTDDKKKELANATSAFKDVISELAHNKGTSND